MTKTDLAAPAIAVGLSRRAFVAAAPLALAACSGVPDVGSMLFGESSAAYAAKPGEEHPLPALDTSAVNPVMLRRRVADPTGEKAGTIVVKVSDRHLYYVMADGSAMRYGIGVGREGFEWKGRAVVARKAKWPRWTPTAAMIRRDPKLNGPWAGGMPGGLRNPLGARALYLNQGGRDSSYRIHGTNDPRSIGRAMSSGCVRMFNHDVIDLYERASVGARVLVEA